MCPSAEHIHIYSVHRPLPGRYTRVHIPKSCASLAVLLMPAGLSPQVNVWSMLEVNIAILCASVAALRPLFTPKRLLQVRGRKRFQCQNQGKLQHDSSSGLENQDGGNEVGYSRKPSNTSLYPDLETYSLTTTSPERSPTKSVAFTEVNYEQRPSAPTRLDP